MTPEEATAIAADVLDVRNAGYPYLHQVAAYVEGHADPVYIPRDAREEFRWIARQSRVNVLPLVVDTIAQSLYVDGYRSPETGESVASWDQWQANRMDARQTGVHRAALTYGSAFVAVLPGDSGPAWAPYSPRTMTAVYRDAVNDEWPQYALTTNRVGDAVEVTLLAAMEQHTFTCASVDARPVWESSKVHGVPWCPVVRFVNCYDLDGGTTGEVAPLIPLQDQINLTTFGLLMAQQFGAFKQKWVTGYDVPKDDQGRPIEPFKAAVNRLFVGEGEGTRFGEFDSTDLNGYLASRESTLRNLATIAQVPPNHLIGQMSNLSAEALAAAEVQQTRKVAERKALFGESWEQTLRLSAYVGGNRDGFTDTNAQVVWRDTEARSLAATVDALGKLTQMLGVPPEVLWERIPGVTMQDVASWKAAAAMGDPLGQLTSLLDQQSSAAVTDAVTQ